MKLFLVLFSFYFLALALSPCNDNLGGWSFFCQDEKCKLAEDTDEAPTGDCSDEPCSSFCLCTGCSTIIKLADLPTLDLEELQALTTKISQIQTKISGILSISDIWQPPRLG